jgi:hypothetical protein
MSPHPPNPRESALSRKKCIKNLERKCMTHSNRITLFPACIIKKQSVFVLVLHITCRLEGLFTDVKTMFYGRPYSEWFPVCMQGMGPKTGIWKHKIKSGWGHGLSGKVPT